jgi:hypothetical protein
MHELGDEHAVALSAEFGGADTWPSVVARLQLGASPRAAAALPELVGVEPTAEQVDTDVHETPSSPPATAAVVCVVHTLPSQRSARSLLLGSVVSWTRPTAVHVSGAVQEIPLSATPAVPAGSGFPSGAQLVPFHRSAVAPAPAL